MIFIKKQDFFWIANLRHWSLIKTATGYTSHILMRKIKLLTLM